MKPTPDRTCEEKTKSGKACRAWAQYLIRRRLGFSSAWASPARVCGVHLVQLQKRGAVEVLEWLSENAPR